MKKRIFILLALGVSMASIAQVKISTGSDTPDASSMLEVESSTKGFLPPRMTTAERDAIGSPAVGLVIYNTTTNCLNYRNTNDWLEVCGNLPGAIAALSCGTATHNGTLTSGYGASSVSSVVSYTGGNGGTYDGQTLNSTGVTGLTATLTAGTLASGGGSLTYTIEGTPGSIGTASFDLNIGGQSCTLERTVLPWSPISATGGTVTEFTANGTNGVNGVQYRVHSFTTVGNSSFNVTNSGTDGLVDYLVVAGGGGGGGGYGGGGGAGGFRSGTGLSVNAGTDYIITVGNGGAYESDGGNSVFSTITSTGGGRGGSSHNMISGSSGGSGGGGRPSGGTGNTPATTPSQGNNGAAGSHEVGGGGGGAGAPGDGRNGGNGLQSFISGASPAPYYAGGGGGYAGSGWGTGGLGGGGGAGQSGTANTGGGGGAHNGSSFGSGGSGIVIIRYPLTNPNL